MSEPMQLRTDGTEVPHAQVVAERHPLTFAQREVLLIAKANGFVRSSTAGVCVHAHREPPHCAGGLPFIGPGLGRLGCCGYAASDGNELCKRLEARGLLVKVERGRWAVAT